MNPDQSQIIDKPYNAIIVWLFVIAFMVFVMIVLGGVTRLTQSGLSMVEWKPISGWLPPMNSGDWQLLFDKYRQFPEFAQNNPDMTVFDFENIFWLEYIHRVWGRLIGIVFLLPMMFFLLSKQLSGKVAIHALVIFLLGGLQGGLGWFMVKSGLIDEPDVSQYRLTAHLGLAVIILAYSLTLAFDLIKKQRPTVLLGDTSSTTIIRFSDVILGMIFITLLSGGFVAGLDAGLVYNTFPLMDGQLIPDEAFDLTPLYLNAFENVALVQFDHRILAITTTVFVIIFQIKSIGLNLPGRSMLISKLLVLMVFIQAGLGISTVLLAAPVALAATHQAGAIILFGLALWMNREIKTSNITSS